MSGSSPATRPARRPIVITAALLLAALVGVGVYLLVDSRQETQQEPAAPEPITTTLAVPTPAADPIEQDTSTALSEALPDIVLDHVLTDQDHQEDQAVELGAFEAWALTYSAPGSDIEVQVVQWHDAAEAEEHLDRLIEEPVGWAEGEGRRSGDVVVDSESVGRYELGPLQSPRPTDPPSTPDGVAESGSDATAGQESADGEETAGADGDASDEQDTAVPEPIGAGQALWRNGSVVFIATGDAARLDLFYDNFPF